MESLNGVNAITIVFAALCIFAIAYRFYGLWVAQKVLNINAARETPANRFEDGKDYVPTNNLQVVKRSLKAQKRSRHFS